MAKRAKKTTVFLIMKDSERRSSLAADLRTTGHLVTEYMTGREFLIDKQQHSSGAVVVDVRLAGMTGLELAEQLQNERAAFPVILLAARADVQKVIARVTADLLVKPVAADAVAAAVLRVTQGEVFDDVDLERAFRKVTGRQREIITLVAEGKSNHEIGAELGVTNRTVESHRGNIMSETRADDVGRLVRMWRAWTELKGN